LKSQKVFLVLVILLVVAVVGWFTFIYQPDTVELKKLQLKLAAMNAKLQTAQVAQKDLDYIEKRLEKAKTDLSAIESRIVDRKNLSAVTEELRKISGNYDLEITDFTPVIDAYFEKDRNDKVRPLPIVMTVTGRFLRVGEFIESWDNLDFYLVPREIIVEKLDPASNVLTATITTNLYTWSQ